eukprot:CAMPEP_0170628566 /NCGR_PEP_ID=MMETSP0224-20130122/32763_1 /TAXON_ID=285029 /ORGANISM="Togula jolla, Strain CCCM 725" /LENGTH=770 /DNA_ID=CAMNT_0010956021 /DNA_START=1 /DNA_END=2313 /DNA_ORIENTATION=-
MRTMKSLEAPLRQGWMMVGAIFVCGFALMGITGRELYRHVPPIPTFRVAGLEGHDVIFTDEDVLMGQEIWQSIGGQQVGSIWGHGSLQAPDWTADWLHREAVATLAIMGPLKGEQYVAEVRNNTHDNSTNEAWITPARAKAVAKVTKYYVALFTGVETGESGEDLVQLRSLHALKDIMLHDTEKARKMCAFIFWSAWAGATSRPGLSDTYTNNWPAERLVGNYVTGSVVFWSLISIALLVGGIGALTWTKAGERQFEYDPPEEDPLSKIVVTPSMRATIKWAWTVAFLLGLQICLGVYLAHISVDGPLGIPKCITQHLTYTVARTWHLQSAVFAIATSFLGAGLFLGPIIGGRSKDPPLQWLGVNFLWLCLLIIVVGSFGGNIAAIQQAFEDLRMSQWFGIQGYEYVDLGRFWQCFLMVGLVLWLILMLNAIWPAIFRTTRDHDERGEWHMVMMFLGAAVLISAFYSAGFMYGPRTNLAIMDYWRFWIVHMWVEGMFEVFITVIVAFLFVKLGVMDPQSAASSSLFTTGVFLFGGIPGMYHHNYFAGTPTMIVAVGACFSALEVVPLALMGFEAKEYMALQAAASRQSSVWLLKYKPILDCFVYVAFWNMVGAGFLGFLINPPISLYFMQGGYLTLSHSHGALWGVYGILAMGLSLLILRLSDLKAVWNTKVLDWGLKIMNVGMVLQIFLSLFPIGLYQFWVAVNYDYWYARSDNFHGDSVVQWLKLCRAAGDSTFALGMLMVLYFIAQLALTRHFGRSGSGADKGLLEN